jgi:predicted DNA-binding transcriptional regulator YafY
VLLDSALQPVSFRQRTPDGFDVGHMRSAIRDRAKMRIAYADGEGRATERVVWPFLIAYLEDVRVVAAWCELREAFRHFRTDRIRDAKTLPERYPGRRDQLVKRWEVQFKKAQPS